MVPISSRVNAKVTARTPPCGLHLLSEESCPKNVHGRLFPRLLHLPKDVRLIGEVVHLQFALFSWEMLIYSYNESLQQLYNFKLRLALILEFKAKLFDGKKVCESSPKFFGNFLEVRDVMVAWARLIYEWLSLLVKGANLRMFGFFAWIGMKEFIQLPLLVMVSLPLVLAEIVEFIKMFDRLRFTARICYPKETSRAPQGHWNHKTTILLAIVVKDTILEIEDKDITYEEHWDMEQRQIVKEFLCGKRKAIAADEGNCTSIQYATLEEYKQYEEARKRQKEDTLKAFLNKDIKDLAPFFDISDISSSDSSDEECEQEIKVHEDNEVIEDSSKLSDHDMFVLFDSGSTHTFVSSKFAENLCVKSKKLDFELCVSTPAEIVMCACDMLKSCKMSMHRVNIDCKEKQILFTLEGEIVTFEGVRSKSPPCVISTLQAMRSVKKGCQAYLESMVDTSKTVPMFVNVKVVQDFEDVFPEDLPSTERSRVHAIGDAQRTNIEDSI
ncbi:hypothetical protein FNV43_RR03514 [Rhamnella rubrinervis]|uniref:Uncharacterized protein n=1 Tax=Rhamnella rubrinervis TaxID=2594499 RepID=A0A8K0MPP8_9ROSA|nr:hypothetical protein FNV43_RR03514 [Rhamnella rubrinervis]